MVNIMLVINDENNLYSKSTSNIIYRHVKLCSQTNIQLYNHKISLPNTAKHLKSREHLSII